MPSSLALQTVPDLHRLPSTSINLLPFHIAHTGPAPVSTYFLPRDPPADHPADPRFPSAQPDAGPSKVYPPGKVAAFRGRRIQAHEIPLPVGYVGLVLSAPPRPTARTEDVPIASRRATPRKSAAAAIVDETIDKAYRGGLRRSPRKRPGGEIVNPRGLKRLVGVVKPAKSTQRFSLDSSSENENEHGDEGIAAVRGSKSAMQVDEADEVNTEVDAESNAVEEASTLGAASIAITTATTTITSSTTSLAGEESLAVVEQAVAMDTSAPQDDREARVTAEGDATEQVDRQATPAPFQDTADDHASANDASADALPPTADADDLPTLDPLTAPRLALPARQLTAIATFPALTLWYPDGPLEADGERDEYIRALHEWVALSREMMVA